jgi:pyruvate dehydrogenase (quinone)
MTFTVADKVVARLAEWGAERIFGYPGDGINGLLGALRRAGNHPEFIQSRHEEMSAFEAVGTPSSAAGWACAWRPPGPAPSTCSTVSTTPSSTTSRS